MISVQGFTIKEKVFENQNTIIYRAVSDDTKSTFILKTHRSNFPTNREIAAYRKEFEITSKLQIDGILKSYFLKKNGTQYTIIFEDMDGIPLRSFISNNNLSLQVLLEIFLSIVLIINQIHKNNIIHKDINPLNILIQPETLKIKIIDFGISSIYSKENIEHTAVDFLEGSIHYISPEQTGRMNRPIDYRSDFYSLGITFYELLTGKTPFESSDTLDVIHSHIAKSPTSPFQRAITYYPDKEKVLTKLSDLILRLLAKDPEKRYQSANGIAYDLTKILEYEKQKNSEHTFLLEIGRNDFSGKLQIPAKLFGREEEKKALIDAFKRILHESSELIFVNGPAGTGKGILVHELRKEVLSVDGFLISGKYEEANRDIPYSGFIAAFREFIRQILLANMEEIQNYKDKFLQSLGNNAKLIANVIPELEIITGKLSPVADIDDAEMANRFHLSFRNFVQSLPDTGHPIVIFLDNFQWADARSFQLLYFFLNTMHTKHILLICAYQTNEANIQSPVENFIREAKLVFSEIQNIKLRNLKLEDINNLIAETLNYPKEKCKELSDLILFKTHGNPFFVTEFLKFIYTEKFLQPVEKKEGGYTWKWNVDSIRNLRVSDNLADIVTSNLKLLHPDTEKLIQIAACLGNEFTSDILCLITEKTKFEVEESLIGAVASGLIIVSGITYRFLHEKVQTAAYSLLGDRNKMQLHAKIAMILLNEYTELEINKQIFSITNHLNLGRDFLPSEFPRFKPVELNINAGKKAKASAAYELAYKHFINGIYFLESSSSLELKELKINAYIEAAECAYLSNQINEMQQLLNRALGETNDLIVKAKVFEIKNKFLITSGNPTQAIDNTISLLHELDVHFPKKPKLYHVLISLAKVKFALRNKNIRELIHYKQVFDPKITSIMRLLSIIGSAAYFSSPNLLPLLILENVYLSLKYGYTPYTPFSFSAYGIILCGTLGEVDKGYEFGRLALNIYKDLGGIKNKTKILHMVNSFISHWKDHLKITIDPLWECYKSGQETGDLEFAFYGLIQYAFHSFFVGKELSPLEKELSHGVKTLENYNHIYSKYQLKVFQLTLIGLMDPKENPVTILPRSKNSLEEKDIDQASLKGNAFYFHFYSLFLNFHFGKYAKGIEDAKIAVGFSETIRSLAIFPVLLFLQSLCLLQEYTNVNFLKRKQYLRTVNSNQRKMKKWSQHCPANFQHKFHLVEAEKNRVLNNVLLAIDYYELSIQLAKDGDFLQEIALANELAGKFFMRVNKPNLAKSYLNSALYYYHIWGAMAKVKQFERLYPGIVETIYEEDKPSETESTASVITQRGDTESFNLATMIKVSEAISREILLEKVLASLVKTLIENAGAERGVLILEKEGKLFIEAEASFGKNETSVLQSIPLENGNLPLTVINYTIRFSEYIVLNDAIESEQFSKDPYVIKNNSRSILCFPIFHKQSLFGIFYLENNLSSYAFKKDSVEFLMMISSQSAISIENARLYASLESRVNERTKELDASLNQQYTLNENLMKITRELNQSFQKIKKDLALAKKIQESILPKNLERINSLHISTFYSPMDEVGGDFFDITQVNERKIRIFLADATGHGIQGALITMAIKSEYESLKANIADPSDLLGILNNEFLRKFQSINAFFTCILLDIDPVSGILLYAAAGHPPQILVQHGNIQKLTSTGKIIGINENVKYRQDEFRFTRDDKLFLYSDGIFEEFNYVRDEFGEEKLWNILKEHGNNSVSETLNSVVQQVDDFLGNLPQEDDMTFIGIEYRL
jgi:predicted ATPase/serine phosphatase RsbU (regulator of sigma subunit)